jgi:hypothetical protein
LKIGLPPVPQAAYVYVSGVNNNWQLKEGAVSPCCASTMYLISAMMANVRRNGKSASGQ